MAKFDSGKMLEKEVLQLFKLVQNMRTELASVRQSSSDGGFLDTAADQLNAIADESETATKIILDGVESVSSITEKLGSEIKYAGARPHFEALEEASRSIFEACQAHDIIGQRIANIVKTINTVEGTLNSLVLTLGDDKVVGVSSTLDQIGKKDGDLILSGPAIGDEGMAQEEIDSLFEGTKEA